MRSAWTKRDFKKLIAASLEGEEEGHEVHVLLRGQDLAEGLWHDAGREAGDRSHPFRVEDLLHDVVRGLDLGDLGKIGADRRGADLARLVAGDTTALAREDGFPRLGIARQLQLRRRTAA